MEGYTPRSSGACKTERVMRSRVRCVRRGTDAAMLTTRRSLLIESVNKGLWFDAEVYSQRMRLFLSDISDGEMCQRVQGSEVWDDSGLEGAHDPEGELFYPSAAAEELSERIGELCDRRWRVCLVKLYVECSYITAMSPRDVDDERPQCVVCTKLDVLQGSSSDGIRP